VDYPQQGGDTPKFAAEVDRMEISHESWERVLGAFEFTHHRSPEPAHHKALFQARREWQKLFPVPRLMSWDC
jgi:hypothetical protein